MASKMQLQLLLSHSQEAVDQAARHVAEQLRRYQEVESKLRTLHQYRSDYQQRQHAMACGGVSAATFRDYYAFIGQLETAVRTLQGEVQRHQDAWQAAQQAWLALRRKAKAYEVLGQRIAARENQQAAKREQRQLDEYALILGRRAPAMK